MPLVAAAAWASESDEHSTADAEDITKEPYSRVERIKRSGAGADADLGTQCWPDPEKGLMAEKKSRLD